jgi:hypothetical protein
MSIDITEFETPDKPDFPRANGAPLVLIDDRRIRMSRPSGFAKPLDDESALTNWRIDRAAIGVAHSKELQARYISTKQDDRKALQKLREDAIQAGRGSEAAGIGTAIHAMSERWEDPDDDFDPPEPYRSALAAYTAEMDRLGLVSILYECAFVNTDYNAAGTADRVWQLTRRLLTPRGEILEPGTNVIGDLKTSKTLEYSMGAFACQEALYAQGQLYDVVNECFLPTPPINQSWGLIAWIPSNQEQGHCEMIWVDLDAGNQAAWLAALVKEYRRSWRQAEPVRVPEPLASVEDALAEEFGAINADADELVEFIRNRMATIAKHPEAKTALARHWPQGVPSPKQGLSDIREIERVITLLEDVEAEFCIGFPVGDPRSTNMKVSK